MSTTPNPPIATLWKELAKRGLKTTGTKPELIKRLQDAADRERFEDGGEPPVFSYDVHGSFVPPPDEAPPEQDWIRVQPNDAEPEIRSIPGNSRKRGRDVSGDGGFPGWELLSAPAGYTAGAVGVPRSQYELEAASYDYAYGMGVYYGGDARYYGGSGLGYTDFNGYVGVHVPPAPLSTRSNVPEYYTSSCSPAAPPMLYHPSGRLVWAGPTSFEGLAHRASVMTAAAVGTDRVNQHSQSYPPATEPEEVPYCPGFCCCGFRMTVACVVSPQADSGEHVDVDSSEPNAHHTQSPAV